MMQIYHKDGHTGQLLPSGDLQWDKDGGEWMACRDKPGFRVRRKRVRQAALRDARKGVTRGGSESAGGSECAANADAEGAGVDKGSGNNSGSSRWVSHWNLDFPEEGEVELLDNWKEYLVLEDLQRIVEVRGYSGFTVSAGPPGFSHAKLVSLGRRIGRSDCVPAKVPVQTFIREVVTSTDGGEGGENKPPATARVTRRVSLCNYNATFRHPKLPQPEAFSPLSAPLFVR